jgi:hypothetical protein
MSKFTNHRAISLFFCRAYFAPVYWARHKTHAEPKVGRSQNGTASNRENLPQSSLTFASAILDGVKGHFSAKLPTRNKAVSLIRNTNVISRCICSAHRWFLLRSATQESPSRTIRKGRQGDSTVRTKFAHVVRAICKRSCKPRLNRQSWICRS